MAIQEIKSGNKIYKFEGISIEEAAVLQQEALTDPITQTSKLNPERDLNATEIGYKPGVTDPIELSLFKTAELFGIHPVATSSSTIHEGKNAAPSQIEMIIEKRPESLIYSGIPAPTEIIKIINLDRNDLEELSKSRSLFLNLDEMCTMQGHYQKLKREPTDLEIETFAQTQSEHCSHKTFKAILVDEGGNEKEPMFSRIKGSSQKHFKKPGSFQVVTAFNDNAGGIRFYDGQVIIGKGESHNSPPEPYAGALTKNGGLFRDIAGTGQGGKNLLSLMINNLGLPDTLQNLVHPGTLHPKQVLLENSRGEREYGNPMGIPTHTIDLHFHPDFGPKKTSLGVSVGIIPENRVEKGEPQKGDLMIVVGGKTGRDGIHGATFSSGEMNENTGNVYATAVQLGDPIVEKTMFDALIVCGDQNLVIAITDFGAGGFSSAVGEMANGIGAEVHLDKIPTKYAGLASWEKWLSESQERMLVAISPDNWDEFNKICKRFDTNADVIGNFTGDNQLKIFEGDELVGDIDLEFLHHGFPQRKMKMKKVPYPEDLREPDPPKDLNESFKKVLSHLNVCSKESMHEMYDKTVQGMTVLAPYVGVNQDIPSDGSIVAPFIDKPYGVVAAQAVNPILNRIDPYWGGVWAFAHAATKYTAIGGNINEAAGIDNYISPFPDEESLGVLDEITDGLCDMIKVTEVPMVSGKDSLSSTYRGSNGEIIKVPPSLNITIFGRIPDIRQTVSPDFKEIGSTICLVGKPDINKMGGSVYFDTNGIVGSEIPKVDMKILPEVLKTVNKAMNEGRIKSAKAIVEGGLATALSQMCFGGDIGVAIDISSLKAKRNDYALFNESAGCMLVEVESWDEAQKLFGNIPFEVIGKTIGERKIKVYNSLDNVVESDLSELKAAWKEPMEEILNA